MAITEILLPSGESYHAQRVRLGLDFFGLTFRWNDRASAWFMDIADKDGAVIVAGITIRINAAIRIPLGGRANLPVGEFLVYDSSLEDRDPGLDDFGSRVKLYFFDADSVAEARGL